MSVQPMQDHVLVEVAIPASADAVWQALRDPARIRQWFGWDADTLTDEINFIFITHAVADETSRTVRFADINDRYEVEPAGEGKTVVRVVRSAPTGRDTEGFDGMVEGWISFTWQLAFALSHHPDEARRTLFFSGTPRKMGLARSLLGLEAAPAAGEPWAGPLGPEKRASGEVWFTARHQIGVTADAWGNGLLVVLDQPPGESKPRGFAMLTLTTYGLSDGDFAHLEERWQAWWDERYETAAPGC